MKTIVPKKIERVEVDYELNIKLRSNDQANLIKFANKVRGFRGIGGVRVEIQELQDVDTTVKETTPAKRAQVEELLRRIAAEDDAQEVSDE